MHKRKRSCSLLPSQEQLDVPGREFVRPGAKQATKVDNADNYTLADARSDHLHLTVYYSISQFLHGGLISSTIAAHLTAQDEISSVSCTAPDVRPILAAIRVHPRESAEAGQTCTGMAIHGSRSLPSAAATQQSSVHKGQLDSGNGVCRRFSGGSRARFMVELF